MTARDPDDYWRVSERLADRLTEDDFYWDADGVTFTVPERPAKPKAKRGTVHAVGTKPTAVIVDIDGTLDRARGLQWVREQHRAGHVILVVTARNHAWDYQRTHAWTVRRLGTIPFVGPFMRADDDMRFACDFKLHVYQSLSFLFDIVAAIDDDPWVLDMWRNTPVEAVECLPLRPSARHAAHVRANAL